MKSAKTIKDITEVSAKANLTMFISKMTYNRDGLKAITTLEEFSENNKILTLYQRSPIIAKVLVAVHLAGGNASQVFNAVLEKMGHPELVSSAGIKLTLKDTIATRNLMAFSYANTEAWFLSNAAPLILTALSQRSKDEDVTPSTLFMKNLYDLTKEHFTRINLLSKMVASDIPLHPLIDDVVLHAVAKLECFDYQVSRTLTYIGLKHGASSINAVINDLSGFGLSGRRDPKRFIQDLVNLPSGIVEKLNEKLVRRAGEMFAVTEGVNWHLAKDF